MLRLHVTTEGECENVA